MSFSVLASFSIADFQNSFGYGGISPQQITTTKRPRESERARACTYIEWKNALHTFCYLFHGFRHIVTACSHHKCLSIN